MLSRPGPPVNPALPQNRQALDRTVGPALASDSHTDLQGRGSPMIIRSACPTIDIPDVSVTEYVFRHAERLGDKPAIVDGPTGRSFTYRQLRDAIGRAAAGLHQAGLRKGDVFAIYAPNCPEYSSSSTGSPRWAGSTRRSTRSTRRTSWPLSSGTPGAKFLVTIPLFIEKAREAAARAGIREIFLLGGEAPGARSFAELRRARPRRRRSRSIPRGSRGAAVLERHHRAAEGRHAHPQTSSPTRQCQEMPGFEASASRTWSWRSCPSSTSTAWSSS